MGLVSFQDHSVKGTLTVNIAMTSGAEGSATPVADAEELLLWMQRMLSDPAFSASNPALVSFMRILGPCFNKTTYTDTTTGSLTCDQSDLDESADTDRPSIHDVQLLPKGHK
jgi:hypothetical protein